MRPLAAALMAGVVAAAIFAGPLVLLVVLALAAAVATGELLRLARARGIVPAAPVALLGTWGILILAYFGEERAPRGYPGIVAAMLLLAFVELLIRRERQNVTRALALTMLPVLTVGVLSSFLVALRGMPEGAVLLVVLIGMVAAAELVPVAFWVARRSEGPVDPLLRMISGPIGALAVAVAVGLVGTDTFPWPALIVLGVMVGMAVPVGRLAAELIDHDLRAPDDVRALGPTLLVQANGLLLAAPMFFYVFRALTR